MTGATVSGGPAEGARNLGPMAWIPLNLRGTVFAVLAAVTVFLLGVEVVLNRSLAPHGIVGLELAGTAERAGIILLSWGCQAGTVAAFGVGLDVLLAMAYASTLAIACQAMAGPPANGFRHRLGLWLAWGSLAAGALDFVENTALAVMLLQGHLAPWATVATACAVPKFLLVAFALLYLVVGALVASIRR